MPNRLLKTDYKGLLEVVSEPPIGFKVKEGEDQ
jgi:hypothetical protein